MTEGSVHRGPHGGAFERPPGRSGVLVKAWPPAAPGLRSTSAGLEQGEGRVVNSLRGSLGRKGR
jgi:hypothetical protein